MNRCWLDVDEIDARMPRRRRRRHPDRRPVAAFLPFGKAYHGKDEFLGLAQVLPNYLDVSKITVHYTIADGDRVAACVGITDVATGELTRFIEQFTIRDGKIVENRLFYHDAGTLVDQPKVV
ncbi:nuclear transport factor 2 family protein [Streptosporangium subroseum]|uniref:nuclear transport factor 2 family protein n=1 Tax=Streptosporangium subroseum TaxID=106412 RepID=UPI0030937F4F|nr:nuclear transport factor 2 family protein [Streptosporangium subroseum]